MKDLYTFDYSSSNALVTYYKVRDAYIEIFNALKLPFLVAEADSGDMGGNLSHEFHFPTSKGEDHVISCSDCDYVANEELAESPATSAGREDAEPVSSLSEPNANLQVWRGVSRDRLSLVNVWYSSPVTLGDSPGVDDREVNAHAVKAILPDVDSSVDDPLPFWTVSRSSMKLINLVDSRLPQSIVEGVRRGDLGIPVWPQNSCVPDNIVVDTIVRNPLTGELLDLLRIKDGDPCPRCKVGQLKIQKAIELGHTFHLGSRYSDPMSATVLVPTGLLSEETSPEALETDAKTTLYHRIPFQMGCHGIGVSRMIGAVADTLADEKGLNWPRVMAPFDVVVVSSRGLESDALRVYDIFAARKDVSDKLVIDVIFDDRAQSFAWKMRDADLVGYPVIVVVGKRWKSERKCEVQCRRMGLRADIAIEELYDYIENILLGL